MKIAPMPLLDVSEPADRLSFTDREETFLVAYRRVQIADNPIIIQREHIAGFFALD